MPEMIAMAAAAAPPKLMTTEELLAMPDDGVRRWLIRGELREDREFAMTMRNRFHSEVEAKVVYILMDWLFRQPKPRGRVYCGEVGCRLRDDPESTVGIDVAYVSHQTLTEQRGKSTLIVGSPILVVEVVSPSTKFDDIVEKIGEYLAANVPLVWLVDTKFRTVTVHRPDADPEMFNSEQHISAEPHLPGFHVPVADFFDVE